MADMETSKLCTHIVQSHFGHLIARVASVLLSRGRLAISQLIRYSQLRPRVSRASIMVLIQHNMVYHFDSDDSGETVEFNVDGCLARLRFGRYAALASENFGVAGEKIVSLILDHGKLKHRAVLQHLTKSDAAGVKAYRTAFLSLVKGAYLQPSSGASHTSPTDRILRYESEERSRIKGLLTAKQSREVHMNAVERLQKEETANIKSGLKSPKPGKDKAVDDAVYFRVHYERFNVHLRNMLVVENAQDSLNSGAAMVLDAVLRTSDQQPSLSDLESNSVSLSDITAHIHDIDVLPQGIVNASSKACSNIVALQEYVGILASADNPLGHECRFLSVKDSGSSRISVNFVGIMKRLQIQLYQAVLRNRYGDDAVRVTRILSDHGKMDEKHIGKVAMMSQKDLRPILSKLSDDSFISLQEVPRGSDRNPARSFYLWHVDPEKVHYALLKLFSKSLFNSMVREKTELSEPTMQSVLAKSSRIDVANDDRLLTEFDRNMLQTWESRRMKLTVLVNRMDNAIFIVRDWSVAINMQDSLNT